MSCYWYYKLQTVHRAKLSVASDPPSCLWATIKTRLSNTSLLNAVAILQLLYHINKIDYFQRQNSNGKSHFSQTRYKK